MADKSFKMLLVVKDSPDLQKQLKCSFEGYEVHIAGDQASEIEHLRQHHTTVVTVDQALPPDPANAAESLGISRLSLYSLVKNLTMFESGKAVNGR